MRVKKFIELIEEAGRNRIPVIVCQKNLPERWFHLSWEFSNDTADWNEFSFHLLDRGFQKMDTDAARFILDYAYNDPMITHSVFDEDPNYFVESVLKVSWPQSRDFAAGGAWLSEPVAEAEYRKFSFSETQTKMALVLFVPRLPDWHDKAEEEKG